MTIAAKQQLVTDVRDEIGDFLTYKQTNQVSNILLDKLCGYEVEQTQIGTIDSNSMDLLQAYLDAKAIEGPFKLDIRAYYPIAESWPKKKKAAALIGWLKPAKPDWDNVGKIVSDALNQIAYVDDAQAWDCHVMKVYDTVPRIEVQIEWEDET